MQFLTCMDATVRAPADLGFAIAPVDYACVPRTISRAPPRDRRPGDRRPHSVGRAGGRDRHAAFMTAVGSTYASLTAADETAAHGAQRPARSGRSSIGSSCRAPALSNASSEPPRSRSRNDGRSRLPRLSRRARVRGGPPADRAPRARR
jgi:hypothetical protein